MPTSVPATARPSDDVIRPVHEPPRWLEQARIIFAKDVAIELRTGEVVTTSAFFGCVTVIMSSLCFYVDPGTRAQVAAGAIWLSTAFAAVLSLSRTWQREREGRAFDALLVSPLSPSAIFMGKALGLFAFLAAVEAVVVPAAALLLDVDLVAHGLGLLAIALLLTPGIAAAGALFGVMTVRTRARDLVLAVVLFPLLSPTLLAAVASTRNLFDGVPLSELAGFLQVMGVFDAVFVVGGLVLFPLLAEGG